MASASLTVEQVLEECLNNVRAVENFKEPVCSLEDAVKGSVNTFYPLRQL